MRHPTTRTWRTCGCSPSDTRRPGDRPRSHPDRSRERRDRPAPSLRGNPAYRRLWSAVAISETGDWLLFIALPLYVLQVSGSALDTSAVFLAELAPAVLVGTVCGPVIDRGNPGRLLTALTGSQAVLLLPLLWLGPDRLWIAYALPPCRPLSRASSPLRCRRSCR